MIIMISDDKEDFAPVIAGVCCLERVCALMHEGGCSPGSRLPAQAILFRNLKQKVNSPDVQED